MVGFEIDDQDLAVQDVPFNWDANLDWRKLRVGYLKADFEPPPGQPEPPKEQKEAAESISPEEKKKRIQLADDEKKKKAPPKPAAPPRPVPKL